MEANSTNTATPKKVLLYKPHKEIIRHIEVTEKSKHANAARMLMSLSAPPETEFLRAYALELDGKPCSALPGENPKVIKRGQAAAEQLLPITTALRDLQRFLAASYRGSFKSEAKSASLRANASRPRHRQSDPRRVRQPLTVSDMELSLVQKAIKIKGVEMADFIRDTVMAVCKGDMPFVVPPILQTGGRNKQYQVRWSEDEWMCVLNKSYECYGATLGKRGYTGVLIRDAVLAMSKIIVNKNGVSNFHDWYKFPTV